MLLRVHKGLSSYRPGSLEGWQWRITRNSFIGETRRRKRRPTVPLPGDDRITFSPTPGERDSWCASGAACFGSAQSIPVRVR